MILEVCRHVKNFFVHDSESGDFELKNGSIAVTGRYIVGQYVAIAGSVLNDGIKRVESVDGVVISFAINYAEYPAWVKPLGTVGLYGIGDKVTHNGERWISRVDNNSWEPGTVGTAALWEIIHDSPAEHNTVDEVFAGTIYGLRMPPDFITICDEIEAWQEKNQPTAITSESFGNYSYSRATDAQGQAAGWETVFRKRLSPHRRMFSEVNI